jgi:hypothetical protein
LAGEKMFVVSNTDGSGEITLVEFAAYMSGESTGFTLLATFMTYIGRIIDSQSRVIEIQTCQE